MISPRVRRLFVISLAVLGVAPLVAQTPQAARPPALTEDAIWGTREFASDLVSPTWMKDGAAYTTIDADSAGHTDIYRVDSVSGRRVLLVRGAELVPPGARQPVSIEEYRFSTDGAKLVILTVAMAVWFRVRMATFRVLGLPT